MKQVNLDGLRAWSMGCPPNTNCSVCGGDVYCKEPIHETVFCPNCLGKPLNNDTNACEGTNDDLNDPPQDQKDRPE